MTKFMVNFNEPLATKSRADISPVQFVEDNNLNGASPNIMLADIIKMSYLIPNILLVLDSAELSVLEVEKSFMETVLRAFLVRYGYDDIVAALTSAKRDLDEVQCDCHKHKGN